MPAVDIMAHSKQSHLNVLTTHHKLFSTDSPNLVSHFPAWLPAMLTVISLPVMLVYCGFYTNIQTQVFGMS